MKKILSITLVVVLLAGIAVSGTMAYLQDTDSDVNVMTLGNVSIEQHEYERAVDADGNYVTYTEIERDDKPTGYKLTDFTQAKPLYPAVGTAEWDQTKVYFAQLPDDSTLGAQSVFAKPENAQDKFVFVENTGKSDAYVRTIAAFEIGTAENVIGGANTAETNLIMMNYNGTGWTRNFIGKATIDGNNYYIVEFVYDGANNNLKHPDGIVHPGEYTYCNLAQVYMTPKATNEDVEAIDGNKNGTYDILVLSQAVQTEGFADAKTALDTAFGEITANNHPWIDENGNFTVVIPELMSSYEDITAANTMGKDGNYVIADDFTADDMIYFFGTNSTIDLNGKTITADKKDQYLLAAPPNSTLHLTGEGTVDMGQGFFASDDNAEIIIDGGTYNATRTVTLDNIKHGSLAQGNCKIVINGGTFTTNVEDAVLFYATSNARIEINGGFFENTADETPDLLGIGNNKYHTNRIIITGGTFVNYNPLADIMCYTDKWPAEGEALFDGPWILIPGGYKVVSETQANGDVWYTVVPE